MKVQTRYYWLALTLAVAVVCGLGLSQRTRTAAASSAKDQSTPTVQTSTIPTETYEGIVTDTHCGAKHSAKVGLSAADCTRACVHAGEHFALVDGDKTYILNGESAALKRMAGERVKIAGNLNGNTIQVASVAEASTKAE